MSKAITFPEILLIKSSCLIEKELKIQSQNKYHEKSVFGGYVFRERFRIAQNE